ncbi:hypothetical protein [Sphingomonas sp. LHG3406-1]|nr:hypothetical protein [Sphingomonas sp. LHG3406-1]
MDLNYLYLRRGISLARAGDAACERSRSAHLGLYHGYGPRIAAVRRALGA